MTSLKISLCFAAVAAGCASQAVVEPSVSPLGITSVHLDENASTLTITAQGETGDVIGRAVLQKGQFALEEDARIVVGRRFDVDVLGKNVHHESEGNATLTLPLTGLGNEVSEFLLDSRVRTPLARWQVTFTEPVDSPSQPEVAQGSCPGGAGVPSYNAPCANGGGYSTSTCDQWYITNVETEQWVVCATNVEAVRHCTSPGAGTGCGTAGPSGCANCWSQARTPASTAVCEELGQYCYFAN
jgi:hypothetical protein